MMELVLDRGFFKTFHRATPAPCHTQNGASIVIMDRKTKSL